MVTCGSVRSHTIVNISPGASNGDGVNKCMLNPNRYCSGEEYIHLTIYDGTKHCLEKQRPCNPHLKDIVAFRKWRIDDDTASDAPGARLWGEYISRNMFNKYTNEGSDATLVFQKSIFLKS